MVEELPEIESFTSSLAQMHKSSESPNGKYGFHVTTYMGPLPQDNTWCDTWEVFFAQGMKRMLELEREAQGPSEELDELASKLYEKVIPRLLRPLTVLGTIKPTLIHGDLWYGNCCTDVATGEPIVFDACAFWAHNECEFQWPNRFACGLTRLVQTKSEPGDKRDIASESHTSNRTINTSRRQSRRKMRTTEMRFIQCTPITWHSA